MSFPIDGLRYLEQEQRYTVPLHGGRVWIFRLQLTVPSPNPRRKEMEVAEVKFGFIPTQDTAAYRVRRRYRLNKGGHPQLVLIHYSRGQPIREHPYKQEIVLTLLTDFL